MRSVFFFLWDTDEVELTAFLQKTYPYQKGPPWIDDIEGDPCLYINFYSDMYLEYEPDDIEKIVTYFGYPPSVGVIADVSGRHMGDHQVRNFARQLLTRFKGVAHDGYTFYLWTLEEINSGFLVEGHPFFDYNGWYDEYQMRDKYQQAIINLLRNSMKIRKR